MHKYVAVMNKSIEAPRLMNALGHATIALKHQIASKEEAGLVTYADADGNHYPFISQYGFIVLQSSSSKLKIFHQALKDQNLPHAVFLDTMIEGGAHAQQARTLERPYEALAIYAIAAFGPQEELNPLTKKFSLFR
jgi:hypothetical protein